jgi:hypothetical protein
MKLLNDGRDLEMWIGTHCKKRPSPPVVRCIDLLTTLMGGTHHLGEFTFYRCAEWSVAPYVECRFRGDLATWDFDTLTRLVFLAHDLCIRVSIVGGFRHEVKLLLHPREAREGQMYERHPTLEQAVKAWRE